MKNKLAHLEDLLVQNYNPLIQGLIPEILANLKTNPLMEEMHPAGGEKVHENPIRRVFNPPSVCLSFGFSPSIRIENI